ncbi:unnamed protein product [Staurois parvus]|uniref:Aminotransferase class I/classII large domain-containing protein n=1 Tax=Staurois parvus TaxID=386267 RepID=A0ABN9B0Q6_9NEOB|nr:unnamed protein product [Staurois parvus]
MRFICCQFLMNSIYLQVLCSHRLPDPQRTHVMWGISKDFAVSGVRFGTLYSQNPDVCKGVASLCYFHGVCGPVQYKMAQLLHDRDWINQIYLRVNHARLRAAQAFVADELRALSVPFLNRGAGFFIWIDFRKYLGLQPSRRKSFCGDIFWITRFSCPAGKPLNVVSRAGFESYSRTRLTDCS